MVKFDATAFIAAEQVNCRTAVEKNRDLNDVFVGADKGRDFRHFRQVRLQTVEGIGTVEGGTPADSSWQAGLRRLEALPKPSWITPQRWDELVWECVCIGNAWADKAIALGWSVGSLFGCHPRPWCADGSRDGLAVTVASLLTPVRLIDINADCAVLEAMHGAIMKYRPNGRARQALIWEAAVAGPGP